MPDTENLEKKRILVHERLFTVPVLPGEKPQLIGSKCNSCGEVLFPRKTMCPNCCSDNVEEAFIGPRGKVYSFTIIYQAAPIGYKGPVPYGVVKLEMPEGLRITGLATLNDPTQLKIGMDMELVVDSLFIDTNGNDIIGFKFKPV